MKASHRRRSLHPLLSSIALASSLQTCIASSGSSFEAERFSSSVVTHHNGNDLALRSLASPQRRPQHDFSEDDFRTETYGLKLHRSVIDRDPLYYEDDGEHDVFADGDGDGYTMDQSNDPLSSQHHLQNEWQSPLEILAPLPSLSLEQNPSMASITLSSPLIIQPGYHHKHEIDVNNKQQSQNNNQQPTMKLKTRSTGTTITALLARNSTVLILAADTRATDGSTVADKRCEKLHTLANNVWCAGAGTSADVEAMVRRVKFTFWKRGVLSREEYGGVGNMGSHSNNSRKGDFGINDMSVSNEDRDVPTASVPAMLHYIRTQLQKSRGNLGVNLLAGGYDHASQKAHLAAIHPHGSMDVVTYAALGSGGLAATGVLESKYPRMGNGGCSLEDGIKLAVDAVRAGIANDLGSGSQVDVCVIGKEGVWYRRAIVREEELEWVAVGEDDIGSGSNDTKEDSMSLEEQGIGGVNGFGNVPFAIRSKRIVSGSHSDAEQERARWLDGIVGR